MSQIIKSIAGGGGQTVVLTITGNTGGPASATANNINIVTANSTPVFNKTATSTETLDFGLSNLLLGASGSSISSAANSVGLGLGALQSVSSAQQPTAVGFNALNALTNGSYNTAVGSQSLLLLSTGFENTAIGAFANAFGIDTTLNVFLGFQAGEALAHGSGNTLLGTLSGNALLGTANNNTFIGYNTGTSYATSESNNILIGMGVIGTVGESNVTRIGNGQTSCFIVGIDGVNVGSVATVVTESGSKLGTASIVGGVGITVTPGPNTITINNIASGMSWADASGSYNATTNNGYFLSGASTPTLPAGAAEGNTISFICDTASTVTVTANAGQKIRVGAAISAVAGTAASSTQGNALTLVFRASGSTWIAQSVIGTWTVT